MSCPNFFWCTGFFFEAVFGVVRVVWRYPGGGILRCCSNGSALSCSSEFSWFSCTVSYSERKRNDSSSSSSWDAVRDPCAPPLPVARWSSASNPDSPRKLAGGTSLASAPAQQHPDACGFGGPLPQCHFRRRGDCRRMAVHFSEPLIWNF